MSTKENLEVEIKLKPVSNAGATRRHLLAMGFQVAIKRTLEVNVLFDTAECLLREARQLLRIRTIRKTGILTFKGVPLVGPHKTREEIELQISNPKQLELILNRLGYREVFRYEKFRTEFHKAREAGVVTLDETPIGLFIELEGSPAWIDRTAKRMGYEKSEYLTESYARLYQSYCEQRGTEPSNMTFARK